MLQVRTIREHARPAADVIIPAFGSDPALPPSVGGLGKAGGGAGWGLEGGVDCFLTNGHSQTAITLSWLSMTVSSGAGRGNGRKELIEGWSCWRERSGAAIKQPALCPQTHTQSAI